VALTWDLATKTIAYYVNGQLQSISTNHGKSDLTSISLGDKVPDDEFGIGGDHNSYFVRFLLLRVDTTRSRLLNVSKYCETVRRRDDSTSVP